MFLGHGTAGAPIGILYAGRMNNIQLGTFPSSLTELDMTGTFNGLWFEVILNLNKTSMGPTTVWAPPGTPYAVSSFFDVFAEISIAGGPFMPGLPRTLTLTTPEPSSAPLLVLALVGVAGELRRRGLRILSFSGCIEAQILRGRK
jgi:hypothetical protein